MSDKTKDQKQKKKLDRAERAINNAFTTGKADRAKITRMAQLDAAEAVARAGEAMEADEEADEAMRLMVIAEGSGNREKIKTARTRERNARKRAYGLHRAATKSAKEAYDAIKFSAPNKMGFMRVVQILFAVHIALTLIFLLMTHRDNFEYNISSIMDWVMVILEGVAFWMFANRYKIARPFVIGMAALGLVVPAIADIATSSFNFWLFLLDGSFYIFLILYFALSKRVKATLVNDFSQRKGDDDDLDIKRLSWPFVRNLGIYFVLFSILGHWMEMAMCQLIIAGLVEGEYDPTNTMLWRDWLYPFPMEGMAVVLIALFLYPLLIWLKRKFDNRIVPYVISFFANALACSMIEFGMGLIYNADHQLWDYSDMFGNIMGQVCLQNALAFGAACSVITWFVYPMLERQIARVPRDIMNIVFVGVMVFGGVVFGLYIVEPPESVTTSLQEAQTRAESTDFGTSIELERDYCTTLRMEVEESSELSEEQKEQVNKELDDIETSLDRMEETLKD